jgi:hypothetical protein
MRDIKEDSTIVADSEDAFDWIDGADWRPTRDPTCRRGLCSAPATDEVIRLCRRHRAEQDTLRAGYARLGYFRLGNRDLITVPERLRATG